MKLYSASLYAQRGMSTSHVAIAIYEHSKEKATACMLEKCLEIFPVEEGYFCHSVSLGEIPVEFVREFLAIIEQSR